MQDTFLNYVNDNYIGIQTKIKMLCGKNKQRFDEDVYHEAILRCYNAIEKKGCMNDSSPTGIEGYLIRSYFNLCKEIKRSAMNAKRDLNYTSDNISSLYEDYYNSHNLDAREKIVNDMFKDFSILYIMMVAEQNFDNEHYYLFRLKELIPNMTYKQLQEKTKMKAVRQKVVEVKRFIQSNVTKEEIRKEFFNIYGDII